LRLNSNTYIPHAGPDPLIQGTSGQQSAASADATAATKGDVPLAAAQALAMKHAAHGLKRSKPNTTAQAQKVITNLATANRQPATILPVSPPQTPQQITCPRKNAKNGRNANS